MVEANEEVKEPMLIEQQSVTPAVEPQERQQIEERTSKIIEILEEKHAT
jgi:hypothetical protein